MSPTQSAHGAIIGVRDFIGVAVSRRVDRKVEREVSRIPAMSSLADARILRTLLHRQVEREVKRRVGE